MCIITAINMDGLYAVLTFWIIQLTIFIQPAFAADPTLSLTLVPFSVEGTVVGKVTTIRCSAITNPLPKPTNFTWTGFCGKEHVSISEDFNGVTYSEQRIVFDRDDYRKMCVCSTELSTGLRLKKNITFNVIYGPRIVPGENFTNSANIGGSVKFSCVIRAKPHPIIYWTDRHGNKIDHTTEFDDVTFQTTSTIRLVNVTKFQAGRYNCWAVNSVVVRAMQSVFKLHVLFAPTTLNLTGDPNATTVGYSNILRCSVDASYPPIVSFRWSGTCGSRNSRILTGDIGEKYQTYKLVMKQEHDGKTCSCEAKYSDMVTLSVRVNLTVIYGPDIIYPPKDYITVTLAEGSNLALRCTVLSRPRAKIQWSTDSGQHVPDEQSKAVNIYTTESRIRFREIKRKQAGVYVCMAWNHGNGESSSRNYTLDIQYPPEVVSFKGKTSGVAGEVVSLQCVSGASNPPTTVIRFSKTCGTSNSSENLSNRTTVVGLSKEHDEKKCTCTVSHKLGIRTKSVIFDVSYGPYFNSPTNRLTTYIVIEDYSFILTCNVSAKPAPNVTWSMLYQNTTPATFVINTVISRGMTVSKLMMNSVNINQTGVYQCHASNGLGEDQASFNVTVTDIQPTAKPVKPKVDLTLLIVSTVVFGICFVIILVVIVVFVVRYRRKEQTQAEEIGDGYSKPFRLTPSPAGTGYDNTALDGDSDAESRNMTYQDSTFNSNKDTFFGEYNKFDDDLINGYDSSYDTIEATKQGGTIRVISVDSPTGSSESIEPDYDLDSTFNDYSFASTALKSTESCPDTDSHTFSTVRKRNVSFDLSEHSNDRSGTFRDRSENIHDPVEDILNNSSNSLERLYTKVMKKKSEFPMRQSSVNKSSENDDKVTPTALSTEKSKDSRPLKKDEKIVLALKF